ncbi:hypothetical protein FOZ63_007894 [Perkinsus olseni]|uniref:Uncharacterized protein n=1 Tax=Perkinsus olseni TaxID=32597 RepID=A0A7J6UFG9_PEROL|nr:hypothetical protein FOZ62_007188 [Perkinsus olseni]KAF4755945.1 hypothetical protein FOZ63_007894 [Perkinsus olseni]
MVNLCASSLIATLLLMTTAAGQQTVGKFRRRGRGYRLDIDIAQDFPRYSYRFGRARFTFEVIGVGMTVSEEFPVLTGDSNYYEVDFSDQPSEIRAFLDDIEKLFPQANIQPGDLKNLRFFRDDLRRVDAPFQGQERTFWKEDSPLRSGIYRRYDYYGPLDATLSINVTNMLINGGRIANVILDMGCRTDRIRDTLGLRQPRRSFYHFFGTSTDPRRDLWPCLDIESFYSVLVGNDDVLYVFIENVYGDREPLTFIRVGPPQTSTTPVPMGSESLVI